MPRSRRLLAALALAAIVSAAAGAAAPLSLAAARLQAYLRLDTTNPPGNEGIAAAWLARELAGAGIAVERYVSGAGRVNLVARLRANATPTGGAIALLHHMDVVRAGEGWSVAPFGGEVRDGMLWGRGALDCKSLGIAHLEAMLALARSDLPRHRDLLLVAVADEEAGGGEGTAALWERHPGLFADVALVLNEGGANKSVLGRHLLWGIEVAQKRPLWLEVSAKGRPGHAAGIQLGSAVHQLVAGLARLVERPPVWKIDPAARAYLAAIGRLDPNLGRLEADLDEVMTPDGPRRTIPPGLPSLFLDSLQVTVLAAGEEINSIPAEARARIDIRLLPSTDTDAYLAEVREVLGKEIETRVLLAAPPSEPTPASGPLWERLVAALADEAPVIPIFLAGITDSRYFRERGVAAYGFSPFWVEAEPMRGVHGPDERIPLDAFDRGVERMRRVVESLLATP